MSQQSNSESGESLDKSADEPITEADTATSPTADSPADTEATESAEMTESASKPSLTKDPDAERAAPKSRTARARSAEPEPAPVRDEGFDLRKVVTLASVTLLVVAAIAAVVFGAIWPRGGWIAGGLMQDRPRAEARDDALLDARQAAVNLMSFNPDDVDGSLQTMISSTTGELRKEQTKDLDSLKAQVSEAKTRMQAEVLDATVTTLNSELDKASAFVVLRITRAWPGGQPATFRQLWSLDMVKEGDTWKAEKAQNLGEPVSLDTGTAPTTTPQQPGR